MPSIVLAPSITGQTMPVNITSDSPERSAYVLLKVSLTDAPPPTVDAFQNWIDSSLPQNVAKIQVQAVIDDGFCMLLIPLPVLLWDYLMERKAYAFVEYYWGKNVLLSNLERVSHDLTQAQARIAELEARLASGPQSAAALALRERPAPMGQGYGTQQGHGGFPDQGRGR